MKFNCSVILFVSSIFAQPQSQSHEDSLDKECYTKLECKMKNIFKKMKTDKKYMRCAEFIDDEDSMYRCIFKVAGLRDDQIDLLFNLTSTFGKCEPDSKSRFKDCIDKCASSKPCKETCTDNESEKSTQCLANQYNVKNFEVKKAVQCSKQCNQDTLSEIMDCDAKCNEPLYKEFENAAKGLKPDSQADSKSSTTNATITESVSKDSEPTGSVNTSSASSTSGNSSLSTGLFSAIYAPILLSLIL